MYLLMSPGNFTVHKNAPTPENFSRKALDRAGQLFPSRPGWSTIDVTGPVLVNFSRVLKITP
jgi:hypothetical protein